MLTGQDTFGVNSLVFIISLLWGMDMCFIYVLQNGRLRNQFSRSRPKRVKSHTVKRILNS